MNRIYFDANATTRVHPEVLEEMLPYFKERFGNPSSIHGFGREAKKAMEISRARVAQLINAKSEEIIFTSGGTEADNLAVKGLAKALKEKGKHVITSKIEHHAVLNTCEELEGNGFEVTHAGVDQFGMVHAEDIRGRIKKDTILISVMTANNEVGTIMPIEEISKIATEKGIAFHTDAVQAIGKMPFDVKTNNVGLASISAHKINGPKGIGALYVRKGIAIKALQHGGHHERNLRAGTENIPGIVGFGKACEIIHREGRARYDKLKDLRDSLFSRIKDGIKGVQLAGHPEKRVPNTLNVSFEDIEGETVLMNLDLEGIAVSTGAACTAGNSEPSHVLTSMGLGPNIVKGAIRFSFDVFNTREEIEYSFEKLREIVNRLRGTRHML